MLEVSCKNSYAIMRIANLTWAWHRFAQLLVENLKVTTAKYLSWWAMEEDCFLQTKWRTITVILTWIKKGESTCMLLQILWHQDCSSKTVVPLHILLTIVLRWWDDILIIMEVPTVCHPPQKGAATRIYKDHQQRSQKYKESLISISKDNKIV